MGDIILDDAESDSHHSQILRTSTWNEWNDENSLASRNSLAVPTKSRPPIVLLLSSVVLYGKASFVSIFTNF